MGGGGGGGGGRRARGGGGADGGKIVAGHWGAGMQLARAQMKLLSWSIALGSGTSGGEPEFIAPACRAAVGAGGDGCFVEGHEAPGRALSDGSNALRLDLLHELWAKLKAIDALSS